MYTYIGSVWPKVLFPNCKPIIMFISSSRSVRLWLTLAVSSLGWNKLHKFNQVQYHYEDMGYRHDFVEDSVRQRGPLLTLSLNGLGSTKSQRYKYEWVGLRWAMATKFQRLCKEHWGEQAGTRQTVGRLGPDGQFGWGTRDGRAFVFSFHAIIHRYCGSGRGRSDGRR